MGTDERPYVLRLYVSSEFGSGRQTLSHVQWVCDEAYGGNGYSLEIIDVHRNPERAEEDRILATPTLIVKSPYSQRRLIGDFTDTDAVLRTLGVEYNVVQRIKGANR